jgi:prevent-host-death family protein
MDISIAEVRNRLSYWLKQVEEGKTVRITRRGKPVGVIIDPEEYERLRQFQAYLEMVSISRALRDSSRTAGELYRTSRDELEELA